MYYIEKRVSSRRFDFMLIHALPTFIVFLAFMGITLVSMQSANQANKEQKKELLSQKTTLIKDELAKNVNSYQDTLQAASGLLTASENVSRAEWHQFLSGFDLQKRYPGLQGIGYTQVLSPSEVPINEASLRAEGFPSYKIRPEGQRDIYTAIQFFEPFEGANAEALGGDMFTDSTRRAAMEQARDTAAPALTAKLVLERDSKKPQPSFIMYLPVYEPNKGVTTIEQRRKNIEGYTFAPFRTNELFGSIFKDLDSNYGLKIYDGVLPSEETLLYESPQFTTISKEKLSETRIEQIQIHNMTWTIAINEHPNAISAREQSRPLAILGLGTLFSVLIAGLIYMLIVGRTRALAHKDEQSIQDAKDELLALASHQLRTPATGVKQYVGMLREGYGGALNITQKKLLDKAYESNERQLNTINEMLFIARADAGEMKLEMEEVNLTQMINDVISEHINTIQTRRHKLKTEFLSHPVKIIADKKYLRMAIENIFNNATKYTPDGGSISVAIRDNLESTEIVITDTGVGVDRKDFPLLFRKFSRVPNELTSKVSGSGIGLYLSKQVIDAHHGRIEFTSAVGKGTEFLIILPKINKHKRKRGNDV
jgi:two-component system, sensor histidine kinase